MPETLSIASPSVVAEPALVPRNTARVAISILLTVLDSWAVVAFGGTLYRVSAHHPIWVVLLFVSLFASLARTWYLALADRQRHPSTHPTESRREENFYVPQPGKDVRLQAVQLARPRRQHHP
jgi:hypothetical protein